MLHSKNVVAGAKESGITKGCFMKKERKREGGKNEEEKNEEKKKKKEKEKKTAGGTERPRLVFVSVFAFSVSSANHVMLIT